MLIPADDQELLLADTHRSDLPALREIFKRLAERGHRLRQTANISDESARLEYERYLRSNYTNNSKTEYDKQE